MSETLDWLAELPRVNFPIVGAKSAPGAIRVQFTTQVHERIWEHCIENLEHEVCGVLIGKPARDEGGATVQISGSIRGEFAESAGTQVTFTHRTWDYIHREKDRLYPDEKIVGWYHTHPGIGIFFSGMDRFIHENFFKLPWQVGLVVDPVAKDEGMFSWRSGRLERGGSYWAGARPIQEDNPGAKAQKGKGVEVAIAMPTVELEKNFIRLGYALDEIKSEQQRAASRGFLALLFVGALLLMCLFYLWENGRSRFLYEQALRSERELRFQEMKFLIEELERSGVPMRAIVQRVSERIAEEQKRQAEAAAGKEQDGAAEAPGKSDEKAPDSVPAKEK